MTENNTIQKPNYKKYLSKWVSIFEYSSLLFGLDPEIHRYRDNSSDYPPSNSEKKQAELFHHLLPERRGFSTPTDYNWRYTYDQKDINDHLEHSLSEGYPDLKEINNIDFFSAVKQRLLNKIISNPNNIRTYPLLCRHLNISLPSSNIFNIPFSNFPLHYRIAGEVYAQCWHNIPANMHTPTKEQIRDYILKNHGTTVKCSRVGAIEKGRFEAEFERIYALSQGNKKPRTADITKDFLPLKDRV